MQDILKSQKSHRNTPFISKQTILKDSQLKTRPQAKPVISFTITDFEENMVSIPDETEPEISNRLSHKPSTKNRKLQANKLSKLLSPVSSHREAQSFRIHPMSHNVKKSPENLKNSSESQLTTLQKEELALENQRKALKRLAAMKALAGKMYVSELWSKKQRIEMSNVSPGVAQKIQSLNQSSSLGKDNSQEGSSLAFRRNFKKKIANDLFTKYQSGVRISDQDITVDPPLYEKTIQSGLSSPSARFLQSEYEGLNHKSSPGSIKELRRTSYGRYSRNKSEEHENNLLKVPSIEPNIPSAVSLSNINAHSLLLKTSVSENKKEAPMLSRRMSYRSSLFDISNSHNDLKEASLHQIPSVEPERNGSLVKLSASETNHSLFKVSSKLKKLVFGEGTSRKNLTSNRDKTGRNKFTINIRAPPANSAILGTDSLIDEHGLSKDKFSFRTTARLKPGNFNHSARDLSLTKAASQPKSQQSEQNEQSKFIDNFHKIRTRKQKENKNR